MCFVEEFRHASCNHVAGYRCLEYCASGVASPQDCAEASRTAQSVCTARHFCRPCYHTHIAHLHNQHWVRMKALRDQALQEGWSLEMAFQARWDSEYQADMAIHEFVKREKHCDRPLRLVECLAFQAEDEEVGVGGGVGKKRGRGLGTDEEETEVVKKRRRGNVIFDRLRKMGRRDPAS